MAGVTREQVFDALAARLAGVVSGTVSRRMALPSELANLGFTLPCALIWEQPEDTKVAGRGLPAKRTWAAWVVVYFKNPTRSTAGATIINPILDALEVALAPDDVVNNVLTLGGLVSHCWIEGTTTVATGDTDAQGFGGAVVPVKILVP